MATTTPLRSWADIPPELAGLVLGHLRTRVDRIRFAAVCPEWRAAAREARLPPLAPLLALKDGTFYNVPNSKPFRFPCRSEGFTMASDNWLLIPRRSYLLLLDPFTGATMTLPTPGSVHDIGGDSDSSEDYDDSDEDGNDPDESDNGLDEYDDSDQTDNDHHEGDENCMDYHDDSDEGDNGLDDSYAADTSFTIIKIIVCSPRLIAALFSSKGCCRIAVCRPGASLWSVAWNRSFRVTDMAFYKGRLYVIDDDDESLLAVDISIDAIGNPWVFRIVTVIDNPPYKTLMRTVYLVESHGSLMMVCRRNPPAYVESQIHTFVGLCEPELMAFEADFGRSRWAKVTTLQDDQVLFLGSCSKAVCMPQHDMLGNRLWFLDDYKNYQGWDYCYDGMESEYHGTWSWTDSKSCTPLPMISWKGYNGCDGAAWLFPSE
ncbi:hypothetical protein PR202_gb13559 [Eleusine coracana subsp. coracana]|uniref:KIB1-4 beta-propeller domain-containing protein n=1 Tax=Eleusine coracana subsp. coracana TaxID=191504 RepID=A0AAV5EUF4_ELECO|nr:hypothetical protein QOZ80_9BG0716650 [Eleusine coracana subsp. coracana]GJN25696.1 hypothetical protein PR202_gb13559 [Eleusine coracana subsp. coracana]